MADQIICPNCGNANQENNKFCSECGSSMIIEVPEKSQPAKSGIKIPETNQNTTGIVILIGYGLLIVGFLFRDLLPFIGVIIAIFVGIYLFIKGGSSKKHGKIIFILAILLIIYILVSTALFWAGDSAPRQVPGSISGIGY